MRKVEFRGYDGMGWIYGTAIQYDKDTDTWYMIEHGAPDDDWVMVRSVGQYIGLKDIKDQKIYEGDVVCYVDDTHVKRTGIITFKNGSFAIQNPYITSYRLTDYTIEVIGNKYNN